MLLAIAIVFVLKILVAQSRPFYVETVDRVIIPPHENCQCIPYNRCYVKDLRSEVTGKHISGFVVHHLDTSVAELNVVPYDLCNSEDEICCKNLTPPSTITIFNQSPSPEPQGPSQIYPDPPTREESIQPMPQSPPQILPHIPHNPITSTFQQPEPQGPSQISLTPKQCTCTPFFRCYDEQSSSNLTNVVDDRSSIQESCPSPNDVCCHNLVQSSPLSTSEPTIQPQPPSSSQIPPSSHTECTCTPFFRCYDNETSTNLTGVVNDRSHNSVTEESCPNPNDICCHNLIKPLSTETPLQPDQSKSLSQISKKN